MDGATLQSKVNYGYMQSAKRVGLPYQVFRATGPMNPMAGSPLMTLPAAFSVGNYNFAKAQEYAKATWQCLIDGSQTQPGDILVGTAKTYFIAAQQALLPILAVEAPRTIDVRRPFQQSTVGYSPTYGGTTPAQETPLMTQWPASILQGTKGENTGTNVPDDVRDPWWNVLMPSWPGIVILSSDVLKDDQGRRYIVSSAELTPLGWRITCMEAQA